MLFYSNDYFRVSIKITISLTIFVRYTHLKKRKLNSKIPKVNKRENLLEVSYDLRFFRIQSERIQRIVKVKRLFEIWNYKVRKLKMQ